MFYFVKKLQKSFGCFFPVLSNKPWCKRLPVEESIAVIGQSACPRYWRGFVAKVIYHPLSFPLKLSVPKTILQVAVFLRTSSQNLEIPTT